MDNALDNVETAIRAGYWPLKIMDGMAVYAVKDMLHTAGIFRGVDDRGYDSRVCYHSRAEAESALERWDGTGDPPGNWIVEKGSGVRKCGPGLLNA